MAGEIQLWIDELRANRLSARPQPLISVVDDVVAALKVLQGVSSSASLIGVQSAIGPAGAVYTPSPGMLAAWVLFWGCGGGGGGALCPAANCTLAASGGGGAHAQALFTAAQLGASVAITFGAPGLGGDALGSNGTDGADSSFGAFLTIPGGKGGLGDAVGGVTPDYAMGGAGGTFPTATLTGTLLTALSSNGGAAQQSFRFSGTRAFSGTGGAQAWGKPPFTGKPQNGGGSVGQNGCGGLAGVCNGTVGRIGGPGGNAYASVFEFGT